MNALRFRQAHKSDMDWLYQTFKITMQDYIATTWGWDELMQHHSFHDNLPPASFTIATHDDIDVGACSVLQKKDHLRLEMVLVLPAEQNKGFGGLLLKNAQENAATQSKPLRLSVLKVNPALRFYQRLGFEITNEDQWSYKMQWDAVL